ncbi:hypothetical protein L195_g053617 [Trifolium pratense]|uniref:Uncharacterized protein n=1 Tax=Trifolium pratense TaxID=57577 RepID=A0A2K3KBI3_TRIPR|nr:hypothetical protein L195_g053617 [Trifolium pratense]
MVGLGVMVPSVLGFGFWVSWMVSSSEGSFSESSAAGSTGEFSCGDEDGGVDEDEG